MKRHKSPQPDSAMPAKQQKTDSKHDDAMLPAMLRESPAKPEDDGHQALGSHCGF